MYATDYDSSVRVFVQQSLISAGERGWEKHRDHRLRISFSDLM